MQTCFWGGVTYIVLVTKQLKMHAECFQLLWKASTQGVDMRIGQKIEKINKYLIFVSSNCSLDTSYQEWS